MPLYPRLDLPNEGLDERPDVPARVRRWPDRVRCYKCRCFFDFRVVDRLYCSYSCAGRDAPVPDPTPQERPGEHVPRMCKLKGGKKFKRRYRSLEAAQVRILDSDEPDLNCYYCDYCNYYHLGHTPIEEQRRERYEAQQQASLARRQAFRIVEEGLRRARERRESADLKDHFSAPWATRES